MNEDHRPIRAVFGELILGMHEIIEVHEPEDEAIWDIASLLGDLFEAYVWRECRNEQRSMHAMARMLVSRMSEIIDTHDLADAAVCHIAMILEGLFEPDVEFCHARQASVQRLVDDLFAIYRDERDDEQPSGGELLDDLLAMRFERRRKRRKLRRWAPHPIMVELLARLDRCGLDHNRSPSKAAPAAG